jgi:3-hydroxy acid dehydrogenase / malonic semialdehyde reductase
VIGMAGTAMSLRGKRVLVTGGTTGIGRAIVHLLGPEGARVLTFGRHQPELDSALRDAEGDVHGLTADVATREGVAAVFDAVDAQLGGLDMLVACAALGAQPIHEMEDEDWRYVVETNLVGYLACARAAMARMGEGGGHLLFVSSISPTIKAPGESVYAATKAGVNAFAETLRKEVAERNIKVTVIEPGSVATDMQECSEAEKAKAVAGHAMLHAEEVAETVIFALTRSERCNLMSLRVEPRLQKTA